MVVGLEIGVGTCPSGARNLWVT